MSDSPPLPPLTPLTTTAVVAPLSAPAPASPAPSPGIAEKDIHCLGHLRKILPLLDGLHDAGCARDTAGNRTLFFDDYCKLMLLHIWNPLIGSLRALQEAAALTSVAKALGVKRFSLGSFSESCRVFDPALLKPIIAQLGAQLRPMAGDPRLADLKHALTLVDGTVLTTLTHLARAATGGDTRISKSRDGKIVCGWRLHAQLDLGTFSPHRLDRTAGRNKGDNRENAVLRRTLESGRCYVGDGGYADRTLFDDIAAKDSSYVVRLREDSVFDVLEERSLTDEALADNIVRDVVVRLGVAGAKEMNHTVRIVEVRVTPHLRRTRKAGACTRQSDRLLIVTSLTGLPAELVSQIYRHRYTVELFFRVFKQLLGMRHLLSQHPNGIDIQVHCTVIVSLLLCLITGDRPSLSNRRMINWFLMGVATEGELMGHLNRPDHTGEKNKARNERRKKLGY